MRRSAIDEREHRRGLILGLTLAEVLLLLLFLLMLAFAARINNLETEKRVADSKRPETAFAPIVTGSIDRQDELEKQLAELQQDNSKLTTTITALKSELVMFAATRTVIERAAQIDPSDPAAVLKRALDVLEVLGTGTRLNEVKAFSKMRADLEAKQEAIKRASTGQHNWPPIIILSEANGHFFGSGSADLSPEFLATLTESVVVKLLEIVKQYDVNVIEVIGHTDEQAIIERFSNLDKTLLPFLQLKLGTGRFVPADNAGLGLARAVAVVRVLGNDQRLAGLRILPFSGAQLIDVGDRLSAGATRGDVKERRRIEIRVRRSDK
jgi:flagellar motor protein MotB